MILEEGGLIIEGAPKKEEFIEPKEEEEENIEKELAKFLIEDESFMQERMRREPHGSK